MATAETILDTFLDAEFALSGGEIKRVRDCDRDDLTDISRTLERAEFSAHTLRTLIDQRVEDLDRSDDDQEEP